MKKTIYFLSLVAIMSSNSVKSQSSHGVDPIWTQAIQLPEPPGSNNVGGFLYSNATDLSNGKRIILLNKKDPPVGVYYTTSYDGINWTTPTQFQPVNIGAISIPNIISDQDDNIYITWVGQTPNALFCSKLDSSFNVLIDSTRISNAPVNGFAAVYPTVDMQNRIHVMWHDGNVNDTSIVTECFYSRSTDGGLTFSSPYQLSQSSGKSSAFPRGQYFTYAGDSLAIAWRDYVMTMGGIQDWDINIVYSSDGGANWSSPVVVDPNNGYQGDPDLLITPDGKIHLITHEATYSNPFDGMRIVYRNSSDNGNSWSAADTISISGRSLLPAGSEYDIVNDRIWTFYKEEADISSGGGGGDMMAAYSSDGGVSWTQSYITDIGDTTIRFKSGNIMADGNVFVNYERPDYPTNGVLRVFYKELSTPLLAVNNITQQNTLIYPNPTTERLTVTFGNLKIREINIFNVAGQLVYKQNINQEKEININLKEFNQGIYILKLITTDKILTQKIIKQ